jgi:glucose-6-phosphate 1-dehydrogenase
MHLENTSINEKQKKPEAASVLHIIVVGASGDLAVKKIYPSLFHLYYHGLLPEKFLIVGFARTQMNADTFRAKIDEHLACRIKSQGVCQDEKGAFLSRCSYIPGQYKEVASFRNLDKTLQTGASQSTIVNRLFYLAIPPSILLNVAQSVGAVATSKKGWTRIIIEKPFGRDSESSALLSRELSKIFSEEQMYRIDHYLGKELVQNLMVLRFANLIFEPIWNRATIHNVQITWKEDIGIANRGGYFDQYGIIRDVMQNHLMQILALVAMEPPVSLEAEDIRDEKVKVLRSITPLAIDDLAIGQYKGKKTEGDTMPSYCEEPDVQPDSSTSTFAAAVLRINNRRWYGVPFLLKCGKALDEHKAEIHIQFNSVPANLFTFSGKELPSNELVIRVQPDESIYFRIINKIPGLTMRLEESDLDLQYKATFHVEIPDAYERLILDILRGEKSLFIRTDELEAAWEIFTPVLHTLEQERVKPELYAFGSRGPVESDYLAAKYNVKWSED